VVFVAKLKIYLDTNMVYGLFKRMFQAVFKGREFRIPEKIRFMHRNSDKIEAYTSFFTLIEIAGELRSLSKRKKIKLNKAQIQSMFNFFTENFQVEILREIRITDKALEYFLDGVQWKDAIQLDIARNNGFTLVTDDSDLQRIGKKHYPNILNFRELASEESQLAGAPAVLSTPPLTKGGEEAIR